MPFITLITFQAAPLAGLALLKITFITSTICITNYFFYHFESKTK